MIRSATVSPNPFGDEPRSDHEILRDLYDTVKYRVLPQVVTTNGRVTKLERFMWMIGGGLMVVSAIVVPLFIWIVKGQGP